MHVWVPNTFPSTKGTIKREKNLAYTEIQIYRRNAVVSLLSQPVNKPPHTLFY